MSFRENDELRTIHSFESSALIDIVNRVKLIEVENFINKIFLLFLLNNLSWCGWCFDINKRRVFSTRYGIGVK